MSALIFTISSINISSGSVMTWLISSTLQTWTTHIVYSIYYNQLISVNNNNIYDSKLDRYILLALVIAKLSSVSWQWNEQINHYINYQTVSLGSDPLIFMSSKWYGFVVFGIWIFYIWKYIWKAWEEGKSICLRAHLLWSTPSTSSSTLKALYIFKNKNCCRENFCLTSLRG